MSNIAKWTDLVSYEPISFAMSCILLEAVIGAAIGAGGSYIIADRLAKTIC